MSGVIRPSEGGGPSGCPREGEAERDTCWEGELELQETEALQRFRIKTHESCTQEGFNHSGNMGRGPCRGGNSSARGNSKEGRS